MSIIHQYRFENNYLDSVGGNHGTPNGLSIASVSPAEGVYNIEGDGVGSGIVLDSLIDLLGTPNFSVSCWVRAGTLAGYFPLFSNSAPTGSGLLSLYMVTSGTLRYLIHDGSTTVVYDGGTVALNDNDWHQVVLTDENGAYKVYIDGVFDTTLAGTYVRPSAPTITASAIGRFNRVSDSNMDGEMDEVLYFDHILDPTAPNSATSAIDLGAASAQFQILVPPLQATANITTSAVATTTNITNTNVPIITLIEEEIEGLIEGMSTSAGYMLNWGPVNVEDRALEDLSTYDVYCIVEFDSEDNFDDPAGVHAQAYSNTASYTIKVRAPLNTESNIPRYDARRQLYKAVDDLKKLFGQYPSLNSSHAFKTLYEGGSINNEGIKAGDRFAPYFLDVNIKVWYFQDRANPFLTTP